MAFIISHLTSRTYVALRRQRGQGLVEYALILVLIAVVVVVVLLTNGQAIHNLYSNIACGMGIGHCTLGDQGGDQ
ncbi:MAG: Flp family type IVb pilin [Chloroflexi bacterium]|nr:MAG: Flp family type IVb pilin [Chloroflexota bacterium]TMD54852.1 MAG: Flp family type IVb pilin [Chloroflexota bacterium]